VKPFISGTGGSGFDTAGVQGIDHAKITYYAASIFWRAAVHKWKVGREIITPIDLGPYEENIRLFLREGRPLSPHIYLSVWLSDRDQPLAISGVPTTRHFEGGGIMHRMNIPGIAFLLTIGKKVSHGVAQTCFIHAPGHPVFVSRYVDDQLISNLIATVKDNSIGKPSSKSGV
jgi:hypothetical protein